MAKLDNTKQSIYNIVGAKVEEIDGELYLSHEEFGEPINVKNMFMEYKDQLVDCKLGGALPLSSTMFDAE